MVNLVFISHGKCLRTEVYGCCWKFDGAHISVKYSCIKPCILYIIVI